MSLRWLTLVFMAGCGVTWEVQLDVDGTFRVTTQGAVAKERLQDRADEVAAEHCGSQSASFIEEVQCAEMPCYSAYYECLGT